jgi:phage terminase large subunit GpA-like protein
MSASSSTSSPASDSTSDDPGAAAFVGALWDGATPEPAVTVCEWADEHRIISGRAANERGRWRTARAPYLREPFDLLSVTSPIRRVVIQKASQMGFTESAVNWLGYTIQHAPGPFLFVEPTVEVAKRLSRQKIDPAIAESEALRTRVAPPRSRDASNTVLLKEFPGGLLVLTGANSAAGLCYTTCRYTVLDDIDRYPPNVEGEGNPLALVAARSRTFGARRKELLMSSPTTTGYSPIETEFQATDQRRYFVPCPACGTYQPLDFVNLVWEPGKPKTARYRCASCATLIREASKTKMLARGEWRATAPVTDPGVAGFHISALYCPVGWLSWAEIAAEAEHAARDQQQAQTFANTILGESYAERGETPDWKRLRDRQTSSPLGVVPDGVAFLTAGVDVQADRLEVSIWGWGRGRRSWLIEHRVLEGEVAREEPWETLSYIVAQTWPAGADGRLAVPLARVGVDAGYATTQVHAWARRQPTGRVVLVRGGPPTVALVSLPRSVEAVESGRSTRRRRRGLRVWAVDTHAIKLETYGWLYLDPPADGVTFPAGWVSLPAVGDEFLRQLTAEHLVRKIVNGRETRVWIKGYNRNEALDCRVYARAAAHLVGLDRFTDADWTALEGPFKTAAARPPAPTPAPSSPPAIVVPPPGAAPAQVAPRRPPSRPSSFWGGRPRRR